MNATERVSQKFNDHIEEGINRKDLCLAWIDFHQRNPGAHPDNYRDNTGPYRGWEVLMAERMFELKIKDNVMYPTAFLTVNWMLEQLDEFHSSDEDEIFIDKIDLLRNFFEDGRQEELKEVLDALGDLINYHDGAPEDVFEKMSDMHDALHWIANLN